MRVSGLARSEMAAWADPGWQFAKGGGLPRLQKETTRAVAIAKHHVVLA